MHNVKRIIILLIVALVVGAASFTRATLSAAVVKVADPTSVVMIVSLPQDGRMTALPVVWVSKSW